MPTEEERRLGVPGNRDRLADKFEQHRAHLRTVAYRMLGSASEADDAVQESWIRLSRTDVDSAEPTSVTSRICEVG
jgi:RNA polymerase sigma-70 factor, ECF subfamily